MTDSIYQDDAYCRQCEALIVAIHDDGVVLDRTVFYPVGGGQPGDIGTLSTATGATFAVQTTRRNRNGEIVHVLESTDGLAAGAVVSARIDWDLRHQHMRMHTALHLLGSLIDAPVTGGNISARKSRLDFDTDLALDKMALTDQLNALVAADTEIATRWITQAELATQPELIRTMSVKPPTHAPKVRLLEIPGVDLQPCGGTHVVRTGEIGPVRVSKIENKGRHNRRVNIVFA